MSLYDPLASLPLRIEGYTLEGLVRTVSSGFERKSTVIALHGRRRGGPRRGRHLRGRTRTTRSRRPARCSSWRASTRSTPSPSTSATLDLFPGYTPEQDVYRRYRRWAFESAALDLALRQADTSLHELLGRDRGPDHASSSPRGWASRRRSTRSRAGSRVYPALRFKLDATPDWTDELIEQLQATGAVDSIDFKGAYKGTVVDVETDPAFYRRIAEAFPDAWLEDPDLETDEARRALAAAPGPDHLGRADPRRRGHPRRARDAAHGQPQAVALRLA